MLPAGNQAEKEVMSLTLRDAAFFVPGTLPIDLYYTTDSFKLGFHAHEFTEIAIMFEGSALYETDFHAEKISAGDVLFIPRGGLHRYSDEKGVKLMNILFHFDRLNIPVYDICRHPGYAALFDIVPRDAASKDPYPKVHLPPRVLTRLRASLMAAYRMMKARQTGAMLAVYGAFLQTIPVLLHYFVPDGKTPSLPLPEKFRQTVEYMARNCLSEQKIGRLAKMAGMSQSTFCRTFKKTLGKTPLQYLLSLRLAAGQEFLRRGCSVSEAAIKAGFRDANYFTRLFRKNLNTLPHSWKNLP